MKIVRRKPLFCLLALLFCLTLQQPSARAAEDFDFDSLPEAESEIADPVPVRAPVPVPAASAGNYKIGVGDLLQIEVYDEADLTKEVRVLIDGNISFPLLGSVRALGLSVTQLENEITARLKEKYLVNPQVTVFVKEFSNIYVFGEVKKPGSFPIYNRMTAFEAVTLAGGFTEVANTTKVKVIRQKDGQEVVFEINIDKITKKGDSSEDLELQANDRVIVPRSFF